MAWYSVNTSSILAPIKAVLPGIVISVAGATAGYFIFNNPDKIRGKASYKTWNLIHQYEEMFTENVESAFCTADSLDQVQFRKDYSHHLQNIIENLKDLKGEEKIDKRIASLINLKIARYSESKTLTEKYLDSLLTLKQLAVKFPLLADRYNNNSQGLQENYLEELAHIETRDTVAIGKLADRLSADYKKYTGPFLANRQVLQEMDEMEPFIAGKWRFPEILTSVNFLRNQKGIWEETDATHDFTWSLKDHGIELKFAGEVHQFYLLKANASIINVYWQEKKAILIGCRKSG